MESVEAMAINTAYSEECERGVLGCCISEPELIDEVSGQIGAEDFYDLRHSNTLQLMSEMRRQSLPIDVISLREEAKSLEGGIQALGGITYLIQHQDTVPSTVQLPYYISVVKRKAQRRRLNALAQQILKDVRSDDDSVLEDYFGSFHSLISADTAGGEISIKEAVQQAVTEIEAAHALGGVCTGLATGLPSIDHITGGFQRGDMIVLAGRPSMGKTSLAMTIAENVAIDQGRAVGVASMEMTGISLAKRMISSQSGVDGHSLLTGNLTKQDFPKMAKSAADIVCSKIFLDETSHMTPSKLLARARSWKLRYNIELLIVDYLQLMRAKADNRQHEVALCSAAAKQVAKELDIPVLILSQLNRNVENQDRPPRLSDLKESGSIEQDSDVVGLMYRPEGASEDSIRVNLAKHRNGPTGFCDLRFVKDQTRFKDDFDY